ncbi:hypothetical protein Asal01_02995 [Fodinibius salicampi]
MIQRLLRLLATSLSLYTFYSNPLRFIVSLLCIMLVPYLAYIFWGSLVIIGLAILGIYFIYQLIANFSNRRSSYY